MTDRMAFLIASLTFLFVGLVFILVPFFMVRYRKKKAEKCDGLTTATVVEYICYRGNDGNTYAPVYSYLVNGTEYRKTSFYSFSGRKHAIGDKLELRYNSEKPDMFYVEDEQFVVKLVSVILCVVGIGMIIAGIILGIVLLF